jgi:hypothetical protein
MSTDRALDSVGQLTGLSTLAAVGHRPGLEQIHHNTIGFVAREDDERGGGGALDDPAHGTQTTAAGHVDIDERGVGRALGGLLHRVLSVARQADDVKALLERHAERRADDRVIVGDEKTVANGLRGVGGGKHAKRGLGIWESGSVRSDRP